jgi:hypothetical protein
MTHDRHIYGKIDSESGMRQVFADIRRDVQSADSRPVLTELHKRAGYLITLTYSPSWEHKFGTDDPALRELAREEFAKTAREINLRAVQIGTEADYSEEWGRDK